MDPYLYEHRLNIRELERQYENARAQKGGRWPRRPLEAPVRAMALIAAVAVVVMVLPAGI